MIDTDVLVGKSVRFETLGCKLNFAESSSIVSQLRTMGVRDAEEGEGADICFVNTCTVTEIADRKGRQAIKRIIRKNPKALVVVTGCYAQLKHQEISEISGVDIVIGAEHKNLVIPLIVQAMTDKLECVDCEADVIDKNNTFFPSCSHGDRTRFFLKVQDGCDYFCSYCTIPFARVRSRN